MNRDHEVYLYRCANCETVKAKTMKITPPTHHAPCRTCDGHGHGTHLHDAIYLDDATGTPFFRLLGWKP